MNKVFKYSLLQYVHSELLGERINVGLLVFFPFAENSTVFIYPDNLKRLKSVYPDLQDKKVTTYLATIKSNLKPVSEYRLYPSDFNINTDFSRFIDNEILKIDDSAFQFSKLYESLLYTNDVSAIIESLYNEYFNYYQTKERAKNITDSIISSKLFERLDKVRDKITRNPVIESDAFSYTFDAHWKNGTDNYVKSVSLDTSANSIHQKSTSLIGNLFLLNDIKGTENNRYDIIIAPPADKNLFKDYANARKNIEKAPVKKQVFEYGEIEKYTENALEYLNK